MSIEISFTLNGDEHTLTVDPKRSALSVLRELGARSLTAGCSPQGICGCCAAIVNGKPRLTCTLRAKSLNTKTIETQASFSEAERAAVTRAFAACGATQCGYCTPGIATQTVCLLRHVPEPDADIIDKALNQHVCRCTGWATIREAIALTGKLLAAPDTATPAGLSTPATEAAVTGRRTRIDDMTRPGMVHVAPVFAPHARCRITGLSVPDGVTALTAADIPAAADIGGGQPLLVAVGGETRCAADVVALAVADTAEAARDAAASITVAAEALDPVLHPEAGEIIDEHHLTRGDLPSAEQVAHTATATIAVAASDPAFLEPDAALAVPTEGGLRVYSHSQQPFVERDRLAAVLGVDAAQVQIEAVACGGAFGGRGSAQVAGWAALAATAQGRPARVSLQHEDGVRLHAGRPTAHLSMTAQADASGRLLSIDAELLVDGGGYGEQAAWAAQRAAALMAGPYQTPHLDVRTRTAQTNSPPAGFSRGLGSVPGVMALERCMDQLAEASGTDPLTFRRQNLAQEHHGAVLDAVAPHYAAAREAGAHAGLALAAAGLGLGGEEAGRALLEVQPSGEVRIYTGYLESGQGFEARAASAAAELTGLPVSAFVLVTSTDKPVDAGPALASADRWLGIAAVRDAARKLAAAIEAAGGRGALVGQPFEGVAQSRADGFAALGAAAEVVVLDEQGRITDVFAAVEAGPADPVGSRGQVDGAVHMGLGAALGEMRTVDADGMPETQFRKLGVLKSRVSPAIHTTLVPADGPRPVDDAAMLATAPAVAAALRARGDAPEGALPMMTSIAAKAAGIKPPRPKRR